MLFATPSGTLFWQRRPVRRTLLYRLLDFSSGVIRSPAQPSPAGSGVAHFARFHDRTVASRARLWSIRKHRRI